MNPVVKLIACTPNPIELIYATEKFAKTNSNLPLLTDPKMIADMRSRESDKVHPTEYKNLKDLGFNSLDEYVSEIESWAKKVITMSIPIAEMVDFVFQVSNVTIAWREQLVRKRTGAYWVQSGRITDYSNIYQNQTFNIPGAILLNDEVCEDYREHWAKTEALYRKMKDNGIQDQDAREIIGNGALHRLTFKYNLRSLIEVVRHRCCFIAQPHWHPIIIGIVEELIKIDPLFSFIGNPPCMNDKGEYMGCKYQGMSEERYTGKDPLPVCPRWYGHFKKNNPDCKNIEELRKMGRWDDRLIKEFKRIWKDI